MSTQIWPTPAAQDPTASLAADALLAALDALDTGVRSAMPAATCWYTTTRRGVSWPMAACCT